MVPEEKGSITLSKEAAIIFATAKFKPFKNRIKNNPLKTNPFLKLHENKKILITLFIAFLISEML
ncbi:TPA: hypothetical protein SNM46_001556 [Staphylococcus aureus]|nr:hypothetical protein [Staphylococcus aureus]HDW7789420.1 hypothetical protein [Staphylococcus aureus]HDW7929384.1 hypothetical protein [Staphylococcus aureus]HDW7948294.1 hypothetical protein [Staphylococcus aureus]HEK4503453.1 hypothetical protein [Staphylococcus aureus]